VISCSIRNPSATRRPVNILQLPSRRRHPHSYPFPPAEASEFFEVPLVERRGPWHRAEPTKTRLRSWPVSRPSLRWNTPYRTASVTMTPECKFRRCKRLSVSLVWNLAFVDEALRSANGGRRTRVGNVPNRPRWADFISFAIDLRGRL